MKKLAILSVILVATVQLCLADGPSTGAKADTHNCPKSSDDGCKSDGTDPQTTGNGDRKVDACAQEKDRNGNLVPCGTVNDAIVSVPAE